METQKQRYNGNNFYNNRVHIDYKKQTVFFQPVIDGGIIKYYIGFLIHSVMMVVILIIIPITVAEVITGVITDQPASFQVSADIIKPMLIASAIISLQYFNRNWRNKYYPEYNFHTSKLMKYFILQFKAVKYKHINPNVTRLFNNRYIVPYFSNTTLKYKVTGDYKKFLNSITIENYFTDDPYKWFCVFQFSQKPREGDMFLVYN